ncbi:50S ribosomal protein L10 [Candidatus Roizmanbacteria bacterium RIFCSPLOWO2_01_FULL_45_11]|uniref:Large ribosomal subunit protein uL10 n=1 Tax=Candidatus Roizmanbacteria bacterium RIFCSPLOWO2_01_FULL_45_11 TaxID=1802070 RepID=A0A1F7JC88_9BACT|nr:MAG: 50S ribosomal protein L10 [Candidatus Roizmanbacteria bacterium RIFCSPLOWO2_01_FULL_45_11]
MANKRNTDIVSSLTEDIKQHDAAVLMEYAGVTHKQFEEIRNLVRDQHGVVRVVKNALLKIAFTNNNIDITNEKLTGPTVVVLAKTDNLSPIKIMHDKGSELENFGIKWGVWEKAVITKDYALRLATLPGREQLIAQLVGQLKGPQARLVFSLKGNLQKLVLALNAIREQKN